MHLLGGDNRLLTLCQALDLIQRQTDAICTSQVPVLLNRRNALTSALATRDYLDLHLHFTAPFQPFKAQACQTQPPIWTALGLAKYSANPNARKKAHPPSIFR